MRIEFNVPEPQPELPLARDLAVGDIFIREYKVATANQAKPYSERAVYMRVGSYNPSYSNGVPAVSLRSGAISIIPRACYVRRVAAVVQVSKID